LNSCVACCIHYLRTWLSECSTDFHGHALLSTAWKLFWGHPAAFHFQICLVRCTHWSLGGYQSPDHSKPRWVSGQQKQNLPFLARHYCSAISVEMASEMFMW